MLKPPRHASGLVSKHANSGYNSRSVLVGSALQNPSFKNKILKETDLVVSIEASETGYWKKYTGTNGLNFGIDNFGKSAPYKDIYKNFKLTVEDIVHSTKKMIIVYSK